MPDVTVSLKMNLGKRLLTCDGKYLKTQTDKYLLDESLIDKSVDVLQTSPIIIRRGVMGNSITDRVADVGSLSFALRNGQGNSADTLGYYSPDNANARAGFGLDAVVEVTLASGADTIKDWKGRLSVIDPIPGMYGSRATNVQAEDWLAYAASVSICGITVQTGKRDDEIIEQLLALVPQQPETASFDTGADTYAYSLHQENSEQDVLYSILQKLAMSGFGKIFLRGGTSSAEELVYVNRSNIIQTSSPVATLTDDMSDLRVARSKRRRVKQVSVKTYPVQLDSTNVVLWVSQKELTLLAGETKEFSISLRDPSGRATRVAGTSLVQPVAGTDFNFSSVSGSGSDLNANLTMVAELFSDTANITVTNTSGSTGYILSGFQVRGKATYLYEPSIATENTGQVDGEYITIDMYYQDNVFVGADLATLISSWFFVDTSYIDSVTFIASRNDTLMHYGLTVQVGDLVQINETLTGISSTYFVQGVQKTISAGGKYMEVTWTLIPANQVSGVFILDVSVLDVDILGA